MCKMVGLVLLVSAGVLIKTRQSLHKATTQSVCQCLDPMPLFSSKELNPMNIFL